MKLRPVTLTHRLIVTSVALVTLISLLVAASATLVMRSYLVDQLDSQLLQSLSRARSANGPGGPGFPGSGSALTSDCTSPYQPRGQRDGTFIAVFSTSCSSGSGSRITKSGNTIALTSAQLEKLTDISTNASPKTVKIEGLGTYRVAAASDDLSGASIVQGMPTHDIDAAIARLVSWEIVLSLLGIAFAVVLANGLIRRQMRPLHEVAATAHEVANMPLSSGAVGKTARVPDELVDPDTEVGQVGEALNQMLRHIEHALDDRHRSEQQLRKFLADASHELRTPLSTIKGYAELTRRTGADPAQAMGKVESEAGRMSTLVEDMLLLARLDSGRPLEAKPVDLVHLVVEATSDARVVDPDRRWRVDVGAVEAVITGDDLRLHQAVTNLINNAMRHTPEGTTVTTRVLADPIRVQVHDDGPGISAELLPTIFDRFTRGDSSRTRASGGAGLGMSLVKAIMAAHGGTASVSSVPGDTTFTLTFPDHPFTGPAGQESTGQESTGQ